VAGIKGSAFKDNALEVALFDKELMDRHIVYLARDMGTDGFHEVEIFREVNASPKALVNRSPRPHRQGFLLLVRQGCDGKKRTVKSVNFQHTYIAEPANIAASY
jgi:hypothetical protein